MFAHRLGKSLLGAFWGTAIATITATYSIADTLIIQGSTTVARRLIEPNKAVIEAEAKHELTLIPNKSLPGLIALMEGRAHMAMISSSLKSEIDALQKSLPGANYERLQVHPISTTRIAIVVHPKNPVRKSSLNQVRKILLGETKNWSELGGANVPIRTVLVGGGGGVTMVVQSELLAGNQAEGPHIIYVRTPVQLVQIVEQEPGAVGFAQLSLAKQKALPELITEQPLEQVLSFVTLGNPTQPMIDVIQAARRIAEKVL